MLASIFAGSGVTVVGIVKWMFVRQVARLDEMEDNIAELKRRTVCKDDLAQFEDRLSTTITRAKEEIQRSLEITNTRVDKLFERAMK